MLDRHACPESRTFRYLDLARPPIQVPAVAGLLVLVVQLREANITTRWDAYNRDDLARYADEVGDEVALRVAPAASRGTATDPLTLADAADMPQAVTRAC